MNRSGMKTFGNQIKHSLLSQQTNQIKKVIKSFRSS